MPEATSILGEFKTTPEQRLRRCEKCGAQPWAVCFWWDTAEGPSGCPDSGNVYTCPWADWQKAMHEFRAWKAEQSHGSIDAAAEKPE